MNTPPLLIELLTEELPPKNLSALAEAFAKGITKDLRQDNFLSTNSEYVFFATPRRLAVLINAVFAEACSSEVVVKGPSVATGLDAQDKPTPALLGFAKKHGVSVEALERVNDGKQEVFVHRELSKGGSLRDCLGPKIQAALQDLPIPKLMSYQLNDGKTTVKFARPAHRLIVLHGTDIVPCTVLGLAANRLTEGHRSQSLLREIIFAHANEYEQKLEADGAVIANFDRRRAEIKRQLYAQAEKLGVSLGTEKDVTPLLDEVTALVEWPMVYVGTFESEFLDVPQECLVLTMRTHQKYFPLFDSKGKLTNNFLIVSNMRLDDPQHIIQGNQRVVRPRLADARFFYDADKKTRLANRVPQLAGIVYHNKLGSQLDRVQRIQKLAISIAEKLGADTKQVERAAYLCKADLLTNMVGEFPELQGVMGEYYALSNGEPGSIARAIREHYHPRFAHDTLPQDNIGSSIALADKLETLAGMFGIGNQPTGDKDPYALRRHALGVIRILIEGKLRVSLHELVNEAFSTFVQDMLGDAHIDLENFIFQRLHGYLREAGYTTNEIDSVLCMRAVQLYLIPDKLRAIRAFTVLPEAESLTAANKRVANILKQAKTKGESFVSADIKELKDPVEHDLYEALKTASEQATVFFERGDYESYLKTFAVLKSPIDAFFETVMVMVDDAKLRQNRLALLNDLRTAMNRVADISKLAP